MRRVALVLSLPLVLAWGSVAWAQGEEKPATPESAGGEEAPPATPGSEEAPPATPGEEGPAVPEEGGPATPEQVGGPAGKAAGKVGVKHVAGKGYWHDIKVVSRKLILKQRRVEVFIYPLGVTLNDNLIRHWLLGGEVSYFLSDAMSVGIGGHYYIPQITERAYLMGLQQRVLPTLNKYYFTATANFNYNWMYGKFALHNWFIQQFGGYVGAGLGLTMTAIIPRRAGDHSWNNYNFTIMFPSIGFRLFVFKWLTVNLGIRLYIMRDNFEDPDRPPDDQAAETGYKAEDHAAHRWIPNLVFNLGLSFFLPPSFKYTTFK